MTPPTRAAGRADAAARLASAEGFAETAAALYDVSTATAQYPDVYVTNAVHCGIAAADAICILTLGAYSATGNHGEAVELLKRAHPAASASLHRLLAIKTNAGYSPTPVSAADVQIALRAHEAILQAARASMAGA